MIGATADAKLCPVSSASKPLAVLLICVICVSCQSGTSAGELKSDAVSIPDLGFRYLPPTGLKDKTTPEARQLRDHASTYSAKAAEVILDLSSGADDSSPEWHQVWMFLFPRSLLPNLNDAAAEAKMNAAVAGPNSIPVGQPQPLTINGHGFLLSEFERKEPPLLKHARIYTTICKTQLVSFVFVSSSAEALKAMEESLKTLDFSGR